MRRHTVTYEEPGYEKTNIFAYVQMGQPAGSKKISKNLTKCEGDQNNNKTVPLTFFIK